MLQRTGSLSFLPTTLLVVALIPAPASADAADASSEDDFEWTVGTWQGVRRDGADGSELPMTLRVGAILDGAGQIRHVDVTHEGVVYRGFAVQIYQPDEGRWIREYVNAVQREFRRLEGEVDGARSTWRGTSAGRRRDSRLLEERLGADAWRRTMSVSEDGGTTWRVLWIDELERASPAAAQ